MFKGKFRQKWIKVTKAIGNEIDLVDEYKLLKHNGKKESNLFIFHFNNIGKILKGKLHSVFKPKHYF